MVPETACWESIRGFTPLSLCDWPGRTSAVLFVGGCNLACPTCHNPALAWAPDSLPPVSRAQVLSRLMDRRRWISGVVVSGGEPAACPELVSLLAELKAASLPVKLDSNGTYPDVLERILELNLADEVHVDVKGPFNLYPELTGLPLEPEFFRQRLMAVFELAVRHPTRFVFRITCVPTLTTGHIEEVRTLLPDGFQLKLQDFVPPTGFAQDSHRRTHADSDS